MTSTSGEGTRATFLISRAREIFWPSATPSDSATSAAEGGILPTGQRKQAMSSLDPLEVKLSFGVLLLATIAAVVIPAYISASNRVTRAGKNSIAVAPDAWLLGAVILLLSVIGFVALWKRKRTLVAFPFFLIGFAFTLFIGLVGFVFILLGGWLMLRAWRLNKYGTTNAKMIARETAARPRGRDRGSSSGTTKRNAKPSPTSGDRKAPVASKRYTPKSPARKKIAKPTE